MTILEELQAARDHIRALEAEISRREDGRIALWETIDRMSSAAALVEVREIANQQRLASGRVMER